MCNKRGTTKDKLQIEIRPVTATDCEGLAAFFEQNNLPVVTRHFRPFPLTAEVAQEITGTSHRDQFYAAFVGQKIVGFTMLRGWDEGFDIPSFGVCVDLRHQGQGLGKRITKFAIAEAERLGCRSLRLTVYGSNERAFRLYQELGFHETHRETVVVDNQMDEHIVMLRKLA